MRTILAAAIVCFSLSVEAQVQIPSANHILPDCKKVIDRPRKPAPEDAFHQGICIGIVFAVHELNPLLPVYMRFCMPADASLGQSIQVIVGYVDAQPERHHEQFITLALEGLQMEWPCK